MTRAELTMSRQRAATCAELGAMAGKPRFDRAAALVVARELVAALQPHTERLVVAGSLRRRKATVGDVEILYIPRFAGETDGLFDTVQINLVDRVLAGLFATGVLEARRNARGSTVWGEKNKLAVHQASGIPVDLFAASPANWWNYLVCRTGSALSNTEVATAAIRKGWKWHPYGEGFTDERGFTVPVTCEEDVFRLVGLPYKQPWER